jgi:membrane protease YdiL (CAAX protease family)
MYPVFEITGRMFGDRVDGHLGWAAGLAIYWLSGGGFALCMLGGDRVWELVRPRRADRLTLALVALPAAFAAVGQLAGAGGLDQRSDRTELVLLIAVAIGNGFFEELFWRGLYLRLFGGRSWFGWVWSSTWFGLWHVVPVSSWRGDVAPYVVGAALLGLHLAFIARRTNGVWWPIVAHTCAAFVAVA